MVPVRTLGKIGERVGEHAEERAYCKHDYGRSERRGLRAVVLFRKGNQCDCSSAIQDQERAQAITRKANGQAEMEPYVFASVTALAGLSPLRLLLRRRERTVVALPVQELS